MQRAARLSTATALLALATAACGPTEAERTVDYYKANETERKAKLTECGANPGKLANTVNCKNAEVAQFQLGIPIKPR